MGVYGENVVMYGVELGADFITYDDDNDTYGKYEPLMERYGWDRSKKQGPDKKLHIFYDSMCGKYCRAGILLEFRSEGDGMDEVMVDETDFPILKEELKQALRDNDIKADEDKFRVMIFTHHH